MVPKSLKKVLVMNKCDRDGDLGNVVVFLELKEVRHFPHDFVNFLAVQRTSSCWMTEKLYFPRPRCVAVDGEGVLDDLNIIGIALRCHMTQ